jgi:hypothetical protein
MVGCRSRRDIAEACKGLDTEARLCYSIGKACGHNLTSPLSCVATVLVLLCAHPILISVELR